MNTLTDNFYALIEDIKSVDNTLQDGIITLWSRVTKGTPGPWRRALVWEISTYVQATISTLRREVKQWQRCENLPLSKLQQRAINEVYSHRPREGGAMDARRCRLPRSEDIAMVLEIYASSGYLKARVNREDHGWKDLCYLLGVRNRIALARSHEDIEVTDSDVERVRRGYEWFRQIVVDLEFRVENELSHRVRP